MPEGDDLLTADKVAALLSVSVRTVRRYADSGRLSPVRLGRSVRYRLPDVERLIAEEADTSGHERPAPHRTAGDSDWSRADSGQGRPGADTGGQAPISAAYRVTPAEIEQAVARTSAQYMGDLRTMLAEVGKVYEGQLAAKDETIAELRRRAEVAEAELDVVRLRLAEVAVPPVLVVASQDVTEGQDATATTPEAHSPIQGLWWRLRRTLRGG